MIPTLRRFRVASQVPDSDSCARRTSSGLFDPLAGEFEGVIFRITLDGAGRPLMADSIHACGCYHEFFPGPGVTARTAPSAHMEWAFVPAPLPPLAPGTRDALRLASGTRYLNGIDSTSPLEGIRYALTKTICGHCPRPATTRAAFTARMA